MKVLGYTFREFDPCSSAGFSKDDAGTLVANTSDDGPILLLTPRGTIVEVDDATGRETEWRPFLIKEGAPAR